MLLCGLNEIDITPSVGKSIPGQYKEKVSTGVLDRLYAKAAVFDNGTAVFAMLSVDICILLDEQVKEIRERIRQRMEIDESNVLVAVTHTHSGGSCGLWARLHKPDKEYIGQVVGKCAEAVVTAYLCRKPARVGCGIGSEQRISFHRRYRMKDGTIRTNPGIGCLDVIGPDGPIDPDVAVIRIDDEHGEPMGLITNFACHLDCVGGTMFSGDYPGEMNMLIKRALGDHVVSLFLTGACGNINHINFMVDDPIRDEHWKWMGAQLAENVLAVRETIRTSGDLPIGVATDTLVEARRLPTRADITFMETAMAQPVNRITEYDWWRSMQIRLITDDPEWSESVRLEIQAVRLGDAVVVAVPAELFVEYALQMKKDSKFEYTMVSTLSNGYFGYVPTPSALEAGGYESAIAYSSCLQPDTGEKVVAMAHGLTNMLHQ